MYGIIFNKMILGGDTQCFLWQGVGGGALRIR